MGENNGAARGAEASRSPADREALLRTAAWAFADDRPPLPTPEQVVRFEAEVLGPARDWCAARADKVRAGWVAAVRRSVEVLVQPHDPRFDRAFDEQVYELEMVLRRAGWPVRVTTIAPEDPDDVSDCLNPAQAVQVYAQRRPAPAESRA